MAAGLLEYGPFVIGPSGQQVATIRLQKRFLLMPKQIKAKARYIQEAEERMTLNGQEDGKVLLAPRNGFSPFLAQRKYAQL